MTLRGLVIWLVCALFFLYEFFLRTVLGIFQVPLMSELHLSAVQFATLSATSYQVIYGLMQLPVSIIVIRYGLKKTLLFATITCSIATLGFAFSYGYGSALFFRSLMGLGSSFGFICLLLSVYDWLPKKNTAFFIGLSQFIGTMGPLAAAGPLSSILATQLHAWRSLFIILSCLGASLTLLVFYCVESNRSQNDSFFILSKPASFYSNIRQLIIQKQVWYIGLYSALVYFSLEYFSESEGITFLMAKGLSIQFAAYLISIAWLGYALGCPVLGYFSDKYQLRKPMMVFCIFSVLLSLLTIIYVSLYKWGFLACFFLFGFGASGQSIGFSIMSENCRSSYLSIGLAFNNMLIMLYTAFSAPLLGWMLDKKPPYISTLMHYQKNFSLLIVLISAGTVLGLFFIKETFCKQVHEITPLQFQS
ncbi:MFS transporter [uncultured Legionella sp.]|uniref:MFS transporter n=1 Tax=uncultured Legionella sp. TaxID=210934 RepID=UPI0026165C8D|nr:MFS transporter [uncultured Legionella sp.]